MIVLLAKLAHCGGENDKTLVNGRETTVAVIIGPLFEGVRIREEGSSQPERAGRGVLYIMGRSKEGDQKWMKAEKA